MWKLENFLNIVYERVPSTHDTQANVQECWLVNNKSMNDYIKLVSIELFWAVHFEIIINS